MTWLHPASWIAVAAVAVPGVIHLLAHRRAERLAFPTLRFIRATRLAAIHRRVLEDLPLLAVRVLIVVSAVAAFAGPLLMTAGRRAAWNGRLVRAIVAAPGTDGPSTNGEFAFRTQRIDASEMPPKKPLPVSNADAASFSSSTARNAAMATPAFSNWWRP